MWSSEAVGMARTGLPC
uniref:Uncharacterized protein n=1 Tax=Arundo donax TaxID=35708 RepID=A0A0A8YPA1_ARUDO